MWPVFHFLQWNMRINMQGFDWFHLSQKYKWLLGVIHEYRSPKQGIFRRPSPLFGQLYWILNQTPSSPLPSVYVIHEWPLMYLLSLGEDSLVYPILPMFPRKYELFNIWWSSQKITRDREHTWNIDAPVCTNPVQWYLQKQPYNFPYYFR